MASSKQALIAVRLNQFQKFNNHDDFPLLPSSLMLKIHKHSRHMHHTKEAQIIAKYIEMHSKIYTKLY